ncbi:MAG TPA: DUF3341 domain-containing protein [Rhodanobacteraceae bacterium]|nr:DUF3341 domain-containing protein [Rhodanobacteraceae bacterium]
MTRAGWMLEFAGPAALLAAVARLRAEGFTRIEAYSPFPVDGLAEALGAPRSRVPLAMLVGGLGAGVFTLGMEAWASIVAYPINVGGRPNASWPAFLPPALEMIFLGASVLGVLAMLFLDRLPRWYHPSFNVARFTAASRDGFFLMLYASDPLAGDSGEAAVRVLLDDLGAQGLSEVRP